MSWVDDQDAERPSIPFGLTFISWLHIVGGGIGVIATPVLALLMVMSVEFRDQFISTGTSPIALLLVLGILAVIVLVSGIGLLCAKPWGWHLAVAYYVSSVCRNTYAVVNSFFAEAAEDVDFSQVSVQAIKYGLRAFVHFLIGFSLLRPSVLAWCNVEDKGFLRTMTPPVSMGLGLLGLYFLVSIFVP